MRTVRITCSSPTPPYRTAGLTFRAAPLAATAKSGPFQFGVPSSPQAPRCAAPFTLPAAGSSKRNGEGARNGSRCLCTYPKRQRACRRVAPEGCASDLRFRSHASVARRDMVFLRCPCRRQSVYGNFQPAPVHSSGQSLKDASRRRRRRQRSMMVRSAACRAGASRSPLLLSPFDQLQPSVPDRSTIALLETNRFSDPRCSAQRCRSRRQEVAFMADECSRIQGAHELVGCEQRCPMTQPTKCPSKLASHRRCPRNTRSGSRPNLVAP